MMGLRRFRASFVANTRPRCPVQPTGGVSGRPTPLEYCKQRGLVEMGVRYSSTNESTLAAQKTCILVKKGSSIHISSDSSLAGLPIGYVRESYSVVVDDCLRKAFRFKTWRQTMAFANQVAIIAQEQKHHPMIKVEYGLVEVIWYTHVIGGVHENDIIMAAKTQEIADRADGLIENTSNAEKAKQTTER